MPCVPGRTSGRSALADLVADPEGPHYAVGHRDDVRNLTSAWNDELGKLLERCWPGPVEVFLPRTDSGGPYDVEADSGAWAVTVGMPDGRALRKLCREHGPWRTVPLRLTEAREVAHAFAVADVAFVVDGGRREGEPPTVVDATVTPVRVLREGALPAQFHRRHHGHGQPAPVLLPDPHQGRLSAGRVHNGACSTAPQSSTTRSTTPLGKDYAAESESVLAHIGSVRG